MPLVFHGSPHRFSEFSLEHVGTGEGGAAYGYGIYLAEEIDVALTYRDTLTHYVPENTRRELLAFGVSELVADAFADYYSKVGRGGAGGILPIDSFSAMMNEASGSEIIDRYRQAVRNDLPTLSAALSHLSGQLYRAAIPSDEHFLLWDAPMHAQSELVRKALNLPQGDELECVPDGTAWGVRNARTGEIVSTNWASKDTAQRMAQLSKSAPELNLKGSHFYERKCKELGGKKLASEWLRGLGVVGLKYLDGDSRNIGRGTHNYVVFDASKIVIDAVYSEARKQFEPLLVSPRRASTRPAKELAISGQRAKEFLKSAGKAPRP